MEFFSADLEQFPLMYVHLLADRVNVDEFGEYSPENKQRIFGFGLSAVWSDVKKNGLYNIVISFACNIPQLLSPTYDNLILKEISHRIGLADKVSYDDLTHICQKSPKSLPLLQKIWKDKIEIVYGKYIPHGRIFDDLYGLVRFSASGNAPRLGKTSEYRMLYWYMSDLGEKVHYNSDMQKFNFMEFYLIPTYEEVVNEALQFFPLFLNFYRSTKKFWQLEYTEIFNVGGHDFKYAGPSALPQKAAEFETRYPNLLGSDYDNISRLRQIFNRMPSRLYGYIWNLMTPVSNDFRVVFNKRDTFKEFYRDHSSKKGSSSKVIACYLQQAFGIEAFPIDTWVKTFIYYPLGMSPKDNGKGEPTEETQNSLYEKYNRLDKLEKLIWASSMGNKTNKKEFMDILWCQRYGTDQGGNGPCRGANPLSCSNCILSDECPSYQSIKDEDIYVSGNKANLELHMKQDDLFFGVLTDGNTPRQVYTLQRNKLSERDTHSGLDLSTDIKIADGLLTVAQLVRQLLLFKGTKN
ncbi:hypothetical protein OAO51_05005 [Nitrosomonadaceae bacterium]|nr:hypothetical protein [Nitrosomonadaceae bacterium]